MVLLIDLPLASPISIGVTASKTKGVMMGETNMCDVCKTQVL